MTEAKAMIQRPILFILALMFARRTIRTYGLIFFVDIIVLMIFDVIKVAYLIGACYLVRWIVINS